MLHCGGQRKNRFLFTFPGLLAFIASGGCIGELADLETKNPVLYIEFPQCRTDSITPELATQFRA
jgi:hypothetical protein